MVIPLHLQSPASFPPPPSSPAATAPYGHLSVLSWNVLLPNSQDGWWTYKMYCPPLPPSRQEVSSWPFRRELLCRRIRQMDADVVCLQEVSPLSFEEDFAFMKEELGYDGMEMFRKGRFRPATFWKSSRCQLAAPVVHKDRTMLTSFRLLQLAQPSDNSNTPQTERIWHVLNCHLQAGKEGKRRLRQINEGVRAVMTLAKKLKESKPEENLRLIVCGDFNGGRECAAVRYLEDSLVDSSFLEDGEAVSSKPVVMPLSKPLIDAVATIADREPPATLVVPELISLMVKSSLDSSTAYENPKLSDIIIERLQRIYKRYTTGPSGQMNVHDVERWLTDINGKVGRGSEFREAAKQMGWTDPNPEPSSEDAENIVSVEDLKARIQLPPDGFLPLSGFIHVYEEELRGGKFWGIAHDMAVLGEALPDAGVFRARFDRIYCSQALQVTAVIDTTCTIPCPNEVEPSDHLPVAAAFM